MILPTIMYALDEGTQSFLMGYLSQISKNTETPFQIQLNTNDIDDVVDEIQNQRNIALIILGVDSVRQDKEKLALRLGRFAMKVNRNHYVVYIIKCREELDTLLPLCTRSSGIIICPPEEKAVIQTFKMLFEDYHSMYKEDASEDEKWLNLKTEGKLFRIRMKDICLVQAANKFIEFHTLKQTYNVYTNMANVEKMLDDSFIRCHRSYFINRNQIQYIDFREMSIHLVNGDVVPLARSFKVSMQEHFAVNMV